MALRQTRRSVSLSAASYAALQRLATARGLSMAAVVEGLVSAAASVKPEAVARAPEISAGRGPVNALMARLLGAVEYRCDRAVTWTELAFVLRTVWP